MHRGDNEGTRLGEQVDGLTVDVAQHAPRLAQQKLEGAQHLSGG